MITSSKGTFRLSNDSTYRVVYNLFLGQVE